MLSDEIRARLSQLHRPDAMASWSPAPRRSPVVARAVTLEEPAADFASQGEELCTLSGKHARFRRTMAALWPGSQQWIARHAADDRATPFGSIHAELAAVSEHFPDGTLFLDLETCGFAGSMIFLAGIVWHDRGELFIDQLLARDYGEEKAVLETLWQIAARHRVLVTFNGKSFDWPMVGDRSARHRLGRDERGHAPGRSRRPRKVASSSSELAHCDLLHHARRRWKKLLPNCKLQTLERYVCRRARRDDLPGSEVPAAYHHFVRTGEPRQMSAILHHNALDLLTLVQVTLALISVA